MIIGTLVLTKLYTPDHFGVLSIINSIVLILSSFATLNLDNAILIAKREDTFRLLRAALTIILIITLMSLIVIAVINIVEFEIIAKKYITYLFFVPIWLFIYRTSFSLKETLIKHEKYGQISKGTVIKSLFANIFQISFSVVGTSSSLYLVLGRVLGELLGMMAFFNKQIFSELTKFTLYTRKNTLEMIKDYRDFVKYDYYQEIIAVFTQNLIIFVLGVFYTSTVVGVYSVAVKLLKAPINLLGENIRHVFMGNLTKKEPQHVKSFYLKTMGLLFAITIIPFSIIYLFSPQIFALIFEGDWIKAGIYAKYLAPWFFLYLMAQPAIGLIKFQRKIHFLAQFQTISIVFKTSVIVTSGLYLTDIELIRNLSIIGSILEFSLILYSLFTLQKK
jgi:O-antigen/teichoic acid export membrane protein